MRHYTSHYLIVMFFQLNTTDCHLVTFNDLAYSADGEHGVQANDLKCNSPKGSYLNDKSQSYRQNYSVFTLCSLPIGLIQKSSFILTD